MGEQEPIGASIEQQRVLMKLEICDAVWSDISSSADSIFRIKASLELASAGHPWAIRFVSDVIAGRSEDAIEYTMTEGEKYEFVETLTGDPIPERIIEAWAIANTFDSGYPYRTRAFRL